MAMNDNQSQLQTLCARGVFAEWDLDTGELLSVTQIDYEGSKSSLSVIDQHKIVAYLPSLR